MINFKRLIASVHSYIFSTLPAPSPPQIHSKTVLCRAINKKTKITFVLNTQPYPNFTLFYYLCDSANCKHRLRCTYLAQKEFYLCHLCNTHTLGSPLYSLHPISRTCHKCGKNLIRKIPPNYRSQPTNER